MPSKQKQPELIRDVRSLDGRFGLYGKEFRGPQGATVTLNKIDGANVEVTNSGVHLTMVAVVENLEGDQWTRQLNAIRAVVTEGIYIGAPHPDLWALPCSRLNARPASDGSTTAAEVVAEYFYPETGQGFVNFPSDTALPQIEVVSTVQPMTTQFWLKLEGHVLKKRQIIVRGPSADGTEDVDQVGEVEFYQPLLVFRYRRRELPVDSRGRSVGNKARNFVGTINNKPVFGDPVHYWMCTRIDAPSDDGGASFNMTYEFQRHPDSWDPVVIFRDQNTGEPITIITEGDDANPESMWQGSIYRESNFWDLDLTTGNIGGGRPR